MWNPGASLCLSYFFTTFVFFAMYTTLYTYLWKMNMELPSPPLFQTQKIRIHYRLYYQLFSYYCNFRKHIWIHIRSYSTTGIKYCEPHPLPNCNTQMQTKISFTLYMYYYQLLLWKIHYVWKKAGHFLTVQKIPTLYSYYCKRFSKNHMCKYTLSW